MLTRSVGIHHVHAALGGARTAGLDVAGLAARAGISDGLLSDAAARVSPDQFARLVRAVWTSLDDELLGLAHAPHRVGTFATMCHAVVHCSPDLGTALHRAGRFYRLLPAGVRFALHTEGDVATVEFDLDGLVDPDRFVIRSFMAVVHRFGSWLVGRRVPLLHAEFGYPAPPHALEYDLVFDCGLTFSAPRTALHLPAGCLALPVVRDEEGLHEFIRRSPVEVLIRRDYATTVTAQVRKVLAQAHPAHLPGLEETAGRLKIGPQALRRQLRHEGTAFTEVRDRLRRDIAIAHLGRADLSIEDVSRRLGFSEPSAFHRAFKRWTGSTPRAYRPGAGRLEAPAGHRAAPAAAAGS